MLTWIHERENFLQFVNSKIYSTINKTNITKTNKESTRVSVTKQKKNKICCCFLQVSIYSNSGLTSLQLTYIVKTSTLREELYVHVKLWCNSNLYGIQFYEMLKSICWINTVGKCTEIRHHLSTIIDTHYGRVFLYYKSMP